MMKHELSGLNYTYTYSMDRNSVTVVKFSHRKVHTTLDTQFCTCAHTHMYKPSVCTIVLSLCLHNG